YDVPWHPDDYVHRIGRTGRAGASGKAFTLATPDDAEAVANIEKLTGGKIPRIGKPAAVEAVADAETAPEKPKRGRGRKKPDAEAQTPEQAAPEPAPRTERATRARNAPAPAAPRP